MIETKREYELALHVIKVAYPKGDAPEKIYELIEALREVARVAKPLVGMETFVDMGKVDVLMDALEDALDALPDWLTDG